MAVKKPSMTLISQALHTSSASVSRETSQIREWEGDAAAAASQRSSFSQVSTAGKSSVVYSSVAFVSTYEAEEPAYVTLEQIQTERKKRGGESESKFTTVKDEASVYAEDLGLERAPELPPVFSATLKDISLADKAPCQSTKLCVIKRREKETVMARGGRKKHLKVMEKEERKKREREKAPK